MVHRAAARVSLRSRERKLRLFLDLFHPGPSTTVVDVGVTDAPFGRRIERQLLRGALPVARADHRRRPHRARPLRRRVPDGDGRARRRARASVRRRRVRPRLLERRRRARRRRPRRPAAVRRGALPRRRPGLRHHPEPAASRSTRTRCSRSSTGSRTASRAAARSAPAASTTCSTRSAPASSPRSSPTR